MRFKHERLKAFMKSVLQNFVEEKDAETVAEVFIRADMRGLASHGIFRFLGLLEGIRLGIQRPTAKPAVMRETISCALIDGNQGLGAVIAKYAMEMAIKKARKTGISAISVRNTNHFGMTGYYTELAAKVDMIGVACCNTEPAMAPFGGKTKILGTNPFSVAIPTNGRPIILDMATTNITRSKLKMSKSLEVDWVLDKEGEPTNKIEKAFSLVPLGGSTFGYKGFGLALIIDLLSGALSGASCGKRVQGTASLEKCTKGDLFIAINIESFIDVELFKSSIDEVRHNIHAESCLLPGEREYAREDEITEIEVDISVYSQLTKTAQEYGVEL